MKKLTARIAITTMLAASLLAITTAAADAGTSWPPHRTHHHVARDTQWGG